MGWNHARCLFRRTNFDLAFLLGIILRFIVKHGISYYSRCLRLSHFGNIY
jgi:hypothetical protein